MFYTYTHFGRHIEAFIRLEEILREQCFKEFNALLVGPGHEAGYSWEPIELALLLERVGKPWNLTVADKLKKVCEAVQSQTDIVLDDYAKQSPNFKPWFQQVLDGLENVTDCSRETEVRYTARIPERIRAKIVTAQRNLTKPEQFVQDGKYNLLVCHHVMQHLPGCEVELAKATLTELLGPGGILSLGCVYEERIKLRQPLKKLDELTEIGCRVFIYQKL